MIQSMDELAKAARDRGAKTIALVCPEDESYYEALKKAESLGLANAFLVGEEKSIRKAARAADFSLKKCRIIHAPSKGEAARSAVKVVREGKADLLMKGSIDTKLLMKAVLNKEKGLRSKKYLSHAALFQLPTYHKLLVISDVAVTITPTLKEKKLILENAIELMHRLGMENPKAAVLAAVEEVNPRMPATIAAAALAKMTDRKQIKGGLVDGPLALDNAISKKAARDKGIVSKIAGDADILLVPDIEAGNLFCKCLIFLAKAKMAGIIMGAAVPIILTSRADSVENKFLSIALGAYLNA